MCCGSVRGGRIGTPPLRRALRKSAGAWIPPTLCVRRPPRSPLEAAEATPPPSVFEIRARKGITHSWPELRLYMSIGCEPLGQPTGHRRFECLVRGCRVSDHQFEMGGLAALVILSLGANVLGVKGTLLISPQVA